MKKWALALTAIVILLVIYNYQKKQERYRIHQTCVLSSDSLADDLIMKKMRDGDEKSYFEAAEAFGSWPSARGMSDGVFAELGPVDACFAERLYVRAAQLGSKSALDRLENLYDCDFPLSHGVQSRAGLEDVRRVLSNEITASSLISRIDANSYGAGSLACGVSRRTTTCQRPDIASAEYRSKQAILCSGLL